MDKAYPAKSLVAMGRGCAEASRPVEKPVDAAQSLQFAQRWTTGNVEILCVVDHTAKARMFHVEQFGLGLELIVPRGTIWH